MEYLWILIIVLLLIITGIKPITDLVFVLRNYPYDWWKRLDQYSQEFFFVVITTTTTIIFVISLIIYIWENI